MRALKSQVRSLTEVAQVFRWTIAFARTPKSVTVPRNFNLQCTSTEIPRKEAVQGIEVNIRGHKIRRPGTVDVSHNINLTFIETIDNTITNFIYTWQESVWNYDQGVQQMLANCTGDVLLTRLDNLDNPIWQYTLLGCYPEDSDPAGSELSGESEALRPTINLYYDDYTQQKLR